LTVKLTYVRYIVFPISLSFLLLLKWWQKNGLRMALPPNWTGILRTSSWQVHDKTDHQSQLLCHPPWVDHSCFQSLPPQLFWDRTCLLRECVLRRLGRGRGAILAGSEKPDTLSLGAQVPALTYPSAFSFCSVVAPNLSGLSTGPNLSHIFRI